MVLSSKQPNRGFLINPNTPGVAHLINPNQSTTLCGINAALFVKISSLGITKVCEHCIAERDKHHKRPIEYKKGTPQ